MSRIPILVVTVAALLAATARNASACSCAQPTVAQSMQVAEAVFSGEVIAERQVQVPRTGRLAGLGPATLAVYDVRVERVWKGNPGAITTVQTDQTSSCGFWLRVGERYLLYPGSPRSHVLGMAAHPLGLLSLPWTLLSNPGALGQTDAEIHSCDRSAPLAGAGADLAQLGPGYAPGHAPRTVPWLPLGALGLAAGVLLWLRRRRQGPGPWVKAAE
jgi:hypothetical protein